MSACARSCDEVSCSRLVAYYLGSRLHCPTQVEIRCGKLPGKLIIMSRERMSGLGLGCVKTFRNDPERFYRGLLRGQDVQRHFGADVLERFHLGVRRSHPRLYRAEGMLHCLAAHAHLVRVPIEPRLHCLKDGFVLPTRDPALFACCALALQRARMTGGGPIATQMSVVRDFETGGILIAVPAIFC
jgi:hypothetical protein